MQEKILNEARELISGFLKSRREELGMTQIELAEKTGLGRATIQRMEDAKFWLNMKQYLIICHHLKCYPFLGTIDGTDDFSQLMRDRWTRSNQGN